MFVLGVLTKKSTCLLYEIVEGIYRILKPTVSLVQQFAAQNSPPTPQWSHIYTFIDGSEILKRVDASTLIFKHLIFKNHKNFATYIFTRLINLINLFAL